MPSRSGQTRPQVSTTFCLVYVCSLLLCIGVESKVCYRREASDKKPTEEKEIAPVGDGKLYIASVVVANYSQPGKRQNPSVTDQLLSRK